MNFNKKSQISNDLQAETFRNTEKDWFQND
jgi:hypothetical protein